MLALIAAPCLSQSGTKFLHIFTLVEKDILNAPIAKKQISAVKSKRICFLKAPSLDGALFF